jgi:hypothetical protein
MRRILVDAARARGAYKRARRGRDQAEHRRRTGPIAQTRSLDQSILALHDALEEFSKMAPRQAQVVELRYFGGMSVEEIAEFMKISPRTVERDWDFAKAWLKRELSQLAQCVAAVAGYFLKASSHLNGSISGTTLTSVVNLNGVFPGPGYTSSMKEAVNPFGGFVTLAV